MTLRLLRDLCLVKLAPPRERNHAGLIEAPALDPPICYGKVVQVGPQVPTVAPEIGPGTLVAFDRGSGEPLGDLFPIPHVMISARQVQVVVERGA